MIHWPSLDTNWTAQTDYKFGPTALVLSSLTPLWGRDTTRCMAWFSLRTVFDLITPINVEVRAVLGNTQIAVCTLSQYAPNYTMRLCDWGPVLAEALVAVANGATAAFGCGYWVPTGQGGT